MKKNVGRLEKQKKTDEHHRRILKIFYLTLSIDKKVRKAVFLFESPIKVH